MTGQRPAAAWSANDGAMESRVPSIGIFWVVMDRGLPPVLLVDRCPAGAGEAYGDFLTHGGHHDHWERLVALGAGALRRRGLPTTPAWSEYEEWPRGRVVHHVPTGRFVVYADRQLRQPASMGLIIRCFGLPEDRCDVRGDRHYVSTREVRFP